MSFSLPSPPTFSQREREHSLRIKLFAINNESSLSSLERGRERSF